MKSTLVFKKKVGAGSWCHGEIWTNIGCSSDIHSKAQRILEKSHNDSVWMFFFATVEELYIFFMISFFYGNLTQKNNKEKISNLKLFKKTIHWSQTKICFFFILFFLVNLLHVQKIKGVQISVRLQLNSKP